MPRRDIGTLAFRLAGGLFVAAMFSYAVGGVITSMYRGPRIGAVCNDGWHSSATGRGACSHHGGVSYWVHAEKDGILKPLRWPLIITGHVGIGGAILGVLVALALSPRAPASTALTEQPPQQAALPGMPPLETDDDTCPRCGRQLVKRERRRDGRPFLGCSGFPRCRYTKRWKRR